MSKKVLLLGFGPFLSYDYNPSGSIAKKLNGKSMKGFRIVGKVLPAKHLEASSLAERYIEDERPAIVLGIGLSASRAAITIERVAINRYYLVAPSSIEDEPIVRGGKAAYFSTLPVDAIKSSIERHGIPAEYSFWADTYVSNELFYTTMRVSERLKIRRAGFIHIPLSRKQWLEKKNVHYMFRAGMPSMHEQEELKAVKIAIGTCIERM
jgi:pyroglutamyl-peptidase